MKVLLVPLLMVLALSPFFADAQGFNNKKPRIVGQDALTTREDESITILMTHLDVEDADDWFYPWGFSMQLYPGDNYSLQGNVVIPAKDFNGKLKVPVTVHDGSDESAKYQLEITVAPVNDRPVITGHSSLSTNENQALTIQLSDLTVSDPDNAYPKDFVLKIFGGNHYSFLGTSVTPASGFSGTLMVQVAVNDGQTDSETYALPVTVKKIDRVPVITGQAPLEVNEDESLTLNFSHLTVADEDSNYPNNFSMALSPGENYNISNTTVTPTEDFFGRLTVPVTVNDGQNTSKSFNLLIDVLPKEDIPSIVHLETDPVFFRAADSAVAISKTLVVSEVDGDSIVSAQVGIRMNQYHITADKLTYTPEEGSPIRAVFDANTGVLMLEGQASAARYTDALRSVHYQTIAPATGQTKTVYMIVSDGKSDSEVVERNVVIGQPAIALDIPTGFTPNGDMSNDTWKIMPIKAEESYTNARIRVYNKAGVLVYESTGFDNEWDGRHNGELLPADTYFYTIDLNINSPEGFLKGLVTILR